MTGLIVVCRTSASMCRTTCPPRWIRPRMGGLSFSSVPRPGAAFSLRRRPRRPLWPPPPRGPSPPCAWGAGRGAPCGRRRGLALVAGHHVDLVDLHLAFQPYRRDLGGPAAAPRPPAPLAPFAGAGAG